MSLRNDVYLNAHPEGLEMAFSSMNSWEDFNFYSDMAYLMAWEERIPWLSISEFWNNAIWDNERCFFWEMVNLLKGW
ncbi:MAG TPA: hypothetical protein ENJ82_06065 [Bacteroidetes bacterium]|nr:hypothetical protein [Bacteroidota bacterium]